MSALLAPSIAAVILGAMAFAAFWMWLIRIEVAMKAAANISGDFDKRFKRVEASQVEIADEIDKLRGKILDGLHDLNAFEADRVKLSNRLGTVELRTIGKSFAPQKDG